MADGLHKEILGTLEFHEVGRTSPEGLHEETLGIVEFHEVGKNFYEVFDQVLILVVLMK